MQPHSTTPGLTHFGIIWLGQLVSLIGSALTTFALGVWTYQQTGATTRFALLSLCAVLPGILLAPLAGALVDRWDRRWAMIFSDTGSGVSTLILALLLLTDQLAAWHIYLGILVSAIFGAFQWPAYSAAVTMLVPQEQLGRANGLIQIAFAAGQLLAPLLAGVLIGQIGVGGIMIIDSATFLFALATLAVVRIPRPPRTAEGAAAAGSLLSEAAYGWRYVLARPGMLGMLLFSALTNFSMGVVEVVITPLVLSFASATVLGTVLSIGGSGMLIGSIVMSIWGGPRRRMYGLFGFTLLQGLALFVGGLRPAAPLIAAAAFVFLFSAPMIIGCSQAIWQSKVAPDVQGRVFAVRSMVSWSSLPLAYLSAGPLADGIFEPLMARDGALASNLGPLIGSGPGRGIGLLIMLLGLFTMLVTLAGSLYPRLRLVEDELPDIVLAAPAEALAGAASASA